MHVMPTSFVAKLKPGHNNNFCNESLLVQNQSITLQMQGTQHYQASSLDRLHQQYKTSQYASCTSQEAIELLQEHHHYQHSDKFHITEKLFDEKHIQKGFGLRLAGKEVSQQSQIFSDVIEPHSSSIASYGPSSSNQEQDYLKQRRWLLLLLHAQKCPYPKGECLEPNCILVQQLWMHMRTCNSVQCRFHHCLKSKTLFTHYIACQLENCPVCTPVHDLIASMKACSHTLPRSSVPNLMNDSWKNAMDHVNDNVVNKKAATTSSEAATTSSEASDQPRPLKRMKIQHSPTMSEMVIDQSKIEVKMESKNMSVSSESSDPLRPSKRMKVNHNPVTNGKVSVPNLMNDHWKDSMDHVNDNVVNKKAATTSSEASDQPRPLKCMKIQRSPTMSEMVIDQSKIEVKMESKNMSVSSESSDPLRPSKRMKVNHNPVTNGKVSLETHHVFNHKQVTHLPSKPDVSEMKLENSSLLGQGNPLMNLPPGNKSCKRKLNGVSLMELFTVQQNKDHIISLRQWVGQSKAKDGKNQANVNSMGENSCQLCGIEKLYFELLPIYCASCNYRIKKNLMYYTIGTGDMRHCFCIHCYNAVRGDTIQVNGTTFQKEKLEKKKNDDVIEESWVQCDKCELWQHQICALFNAKRNIGGQAEYTCPICYIEEFENGKRALLKECSILGAKDLPRTNLSDHIEERLFRRLKQERQARAQHLEKCIDEVPGAEELVVRVVLSVDKKLDVKQRFLETFQEENYPTSFPYKSKAILLFQKIEGVEVCIFGMYVQEFGSECEFPNKRRVYLSYLDSVKYFRPDIRTVTGEALRTFVYHEILIGYLDYCKKRGFTSCYIWACPPLKGEDYILYCHPEIQRTPKSDKLREWYLSMLQKALKEKIIVGHQNLYNMFFTRNGECKAKVSAVRLPYFDGDYWPGAAEDIINQHLQELDGQNQSKEGDKKKPNNKRTHTSACKTDLASKAYKDALLLEKIGKVISPMKEDFIMVHLQHACTHCGNMMVSGNRWICIQCKTFELCEKCYDIELKHDDKDRHPINRRNRHELYPIKIIDVPTDTKDTDEIIETEFFDTRLSFLNLCQANHYQYDSLRRAKHSSMMLLYHLHNPTAPAFGSTCIVCYNDIETDQGWRCELCPDYHVCSSCYQKKDGDNHPHKLTNAPSIASCDAQTQEARQMRILQIREMLNLLVHASQCYSVCTYPNCHKFKSLFRHSNTCKTRAVGGCLHCKKIWCILQLHARSCKISECNVPRCRDLKRHFKRLQQQANARHRAAVMEMMRQRAAELKGADN